MSRLAIRNAALGVAVFLGGVLAPLTLGAQAPIASSADVPASMTTLTIPAAADPSATMRAAPAGAVARVDASRGVVLPGAARETTELRTSAQDAHLGAGKNLAMMGVGAAAVAIGLLIDNDAGTGLAIGGGALALFGLYRFLR
jgi:hypothetical protein